MSTPEENEEEKPNASADGQTGPDAEISTGEPADLFGWLRGTVIYYGDIISPLDEVWEADS